MVYEEKSMGCMTSTMRYFLMLINFLFILASIAGVVVGVLLMEGKEDNYLKFCTSCKSFSLFGVIIFASLLVFSLLGFCALWRRNTCLLYLYAFFLVLFFLAATCITVVIIMIHQGKFDKQLSDAWNSQVRDDSNGLCDFQKEVECSGWDLRCPASTVADLNQTAYNSTFASICPDCRKKSTDDQNVMAAFTKTCHKVLQDDINKYYYILLGVGFGLMALTLISIIVSCKVRVQVEEYDELSERF